MGAVGVFGGEVKAYPAAVDLKTLHAKIGQLTLENDFLYGALTKARLLSARPGSPSRELCVNGVEDDDRSRARSSSSAASQGAGDQPQQCLLPGASRLSRGSMADAPDRRVAPELPFRREPDAARSAQPSRSGDRPPSSPHTGEKDGIYRRPNTSKPAPGHSVYPYLLRGLAIAWPNQAWAMDITYIRMARGFVYLAAVVDCLHAYASVSEAKTFIGRYLEFYNSIRPHSSLKALTPDQVYFNYLPESMTA